MGQFVNPDNTAFKKMIDSEIYVDKTGMLEYMNRVISTEQCYICNSRPRRFGKSVAANMLAAYYSKGSDSETMFAGLDISRNIDFKKYLNKYDVIHLDVQWCIEPAGGAEQVVSYMAKKTIEELKKVYPENLQNETSSLSETLSYIHAETGAKFVIIIDEWDVLIRDESNNQKAQEQYINFLRSLFKGVEPTKYIALAYLTGILPIKKVKTQSALNNFDEYTMLSAGAMAPYIGFTEDEVRDLCQQYGQDYEKAKYWYDGYQLGEYHIYNPKAIISLMQRGEYRSYWTTTGSYEAVVPLINMNFDGLRRSVIEMLSGNGAAVNVSTFQNDVVNFKNRDDVITYLIHLGYLGYDQRKKQAFVPNEEIRQELAEVVEHTRWNEFLEFQKESSALLEATLDMEEELVAAGIERIHMQYVSSIQYNNENSLSSVLSIGYLSAMEYYFKPVREFPMGRGFADYVFLPKPEYRQDYPAMVVELKWNQNANTALKQIKEKRYPESILGYTDNIMLVGISYDKKTKEHQCVIEMLQK